MTDQRHAVTEAARSLIGQTRRFLKEQKTSHNSSHAIVADMLNRLYDTARIEGLLDVTALRIGDSEIKALAQQMHCVVEELQEAVLRLVAR